MSCRVWAAPQLRGPAGLGSTANGTAYKGMPFRVCVAPQLRGPAGLGCKANGTAYKCMPFRVCVAPLLRLVAFLFAFSLLLVALLVVSSSIS